MGEHPALSPEDIEAIMVQRRSREPARHVTAELVRVECLQAGWSG